MLNKLKLVLTLFASFIFLFTAPFILKNIINTQVFATSMTVTVRNAPPINSNTDLWVDITNSINRNDNCNHWAIVKASNNSQVKNGSDFTYSPSDATTYAIHVGQLGIGGDSYKIDIKDNCAIPNNIGATDFYSPAFQVTYVYPTCQSQSDFPNVNGIPGSSYPSLPLTITGPDANFNYTAVINWNAISGTQVTYYNALMQQGYSLQVKVHDLNNSSNNTTSAAITGTPTGIDLNALTAQSTVTFKPLASNTTFEVFVGYYQSPTPCTFSDVKSITTGTLPSDAGTVKTIGGTCDPINGINCGTTADGQVLKCTTDPYFTAQVNVCVPESAGNNYCIKCGSGTLSNCSSPTYLDCHSNTTTQQCVQGVGCIDYTACFYCPAPGYYDKNTAKCVGSSPVSITCATDGSEMCDPNRTAKACIKISSISDNTVKCNITGGCNSLGSYTLQCDTNGCDTALGRIGVTPANFIKSLFTVILTLVGGIAVLLIIISGYRIATSRGDPERLKGAQEQLTAAIIGLLFIIFSLIFLEVIGVDLLGLNIPIPK